MVSGRTVQARAKLLADNKAGSIGGMRGYTVWMIWYQGFIDRAGFKFHQGKVIQK